MQALFAQFLPLQCAQGGPPTQIQPFITVSRIDPPDGNVPLELQPALFILSDSEDVDQTTWDQSRYQMRARFVIMACIPDVQSIIPDTVLNPLLDAIDYALKAVSGTQPLAVDPTTGFVVPANPISAYGMPQTLNGLIVNAYLRGTIKKFARRMAQQTWAAGQIVLVTGE